MHKLVFGSVGYGVTDVILSKHDELTEQYVLDLKITTITEHSGASINPKGLGLQLALDTKLESGKIKDYPEYGVSDVDVLEVLDLEEYDCLVETPTNIYDRAPTQTNKLKAVNVKKDIVNSKKLILALNFKALIECTYENNIQFHFETSIGGAILF